MYYVYWALDGAQIRQEGSFWHSHTITKLIFSQYQSNACSFLVPLNTEKFKERKKKI